MLDGSSRWFYLEVSGLPFQPLVAKITGFLAIYFKQIPALYKRQEGLHFKYFQKHKAWHWHEESHNFLKKWKTNLPEDTTVQRNVSIFILATQIQTFSTASKTFNIIGYKWWNPQTTLNAYNKNVTHVLNMFKCWDLVKNNPRGLQMFHLPNKCCSLKSSQLQPWHNQDGGREIKSYPVWLVSRYLCQTLSGGNVTIF